MLKIQKVDKEKYICNWCEKTYNIRNALNAKGNIYFCSMACVLAYENKWANGHEPVREGD